jgi:hypothetical protein
MRARNGLVLHEIPDELVGQRTDGLLSRSINACSRWRKVPSFCGRFRLRKPEARDAFDFGKRGRRPRRGYPLERAR